MFIKHRERITALNDVCVYLDPDRDVGYDVLEIKNSSLNRQFSLQQKENVEDFLVSLDQHFESQIEGAQLGAKKFMICRKGI